MRVVLLAALTLVLCSCGRDEHSPTSAPASGPAKPESAAIADSSTQKSVRENATPSRGAGAAFDRAATPRTDLDMVLILYDHMGQKPPFEQWADQDSTVSMANEFDRPKKREERIRELQSQFAALQGVGTVTLSLKGELSSYDATYREFYVSPFAGGATFRFEALGKTAELSFANALQAYGWKIDPGEAERALQKTVNRLITVVADLRIESARPTQAGGAIQARVLRYTIQSDQGRLADITVGAQ